MVILFFSVNYIDVKGIKCGFYCKFCHCYSEAGFDGD